MNKTCFPVDNLCPGWFVFSLAKLLMGCWVFSLAGVSLAQVKSEGQAVLVWKNGDRLPGNVLQGDQATLQWQSNRLFRDPLEIDRRFLSRIKFTKGNHPEVGKAASDAGSQLDPNRDEYFLHSVDGQCLTGRIKQLDENGLTLESASTGTVIVRRDQLATIVRAGDPLTGWSGRFDLREWESDKGTKEAWSVNQFGHLTCSKANTQIFRRGDLPNNLLLQLQVHWEGKPDWILGFGVPRNRTRLDELPRLETWDDALVLSYKDSFEIVYPQLDAGQQDIKLSIHWNRTSNEMSIHDGQGKLLTQANLGEMPSSIKPGVLIENKGANLSVEELQVRTSSPGFDPTQSSIETVSGSAINAELVGFDGMSWRIKKADDDVQEIPSSEFVSAFLINSPVTQTDRKFSIEYFDGKVVFGELESINGEQVRVQSKMSEQLMTLRLAGVSSINLDDGTKGQELESGSETTEVLVTDEGTIHGKLESGDGGESDILRWRTPGAFHAVPFAQGDSKIVLNSMVEGEDRTASQYSDTMYFKNRDIIPANILSLDTEKVAIDSFIEKDSIDVSMLSGIDFGVSAQRSPVAVDPEGWYVSNPKAVASILKDGKVTPRSGVLVGHQSLLESGAFSFDAEFRSDYSVLQLFLFERQVEFPQKQVVIYITAYNGNLNISEQSNEFESRRSAKMKSNNRISFQVKEGFLLARVNQKEVLRTKLAAQASLGRGVLIASENADVILSDFTIDELADSRNAYVDAERKDLALTIPRLKKNALPANIVCARNSDLLRGDVIRLTDTMMEVRTGEEKKQYPRSIVSTIVWPDMSQLKAELKKEAEQNVSSIAGEGQSGNGQSADGDDLNKASKAVLAGVEDGSKSTAEQNGQRAQVILQGGRQMTLNLVAWTEGNLVGQSEVLGNCKIPFSEILELRMGSFASEAKDVPYADWISKLAPAPKMEDTADVGGGSFGADSPLIGKQAKDFTLENMDGQKVTLAEYKGKVLILDFWATWCGPCISELPKIAEVVGEYSVDDVALLAVNQEESHDTVEAFMAQRQWHLTVGLDSGNVGRAYDVTSLPTTVIIDREGKVAFVKVGSDADSQKKLRQAIDGLLEREKLIEPNK